MNFECGSIIEKQRTLLVETARPEEVLESFDAFLGEIGVVIEGKEQKIQEPQENFGTEKGSESGTAIQAESE